jgi:hypothetical protein
MPLKDAIDYIQFMFLTHTILQSFLLFDCASSARIFAKDTAAAPRRIRGSNGAISWPATLVTVNNAVNSRLSIRVQLWRHADWRIACYQYTVNSLCDDSARCTTGLLIFRPPTGPAILRSQTASPQTFRAGGLYREIACRRSVRWPDGWDSTLRLWREAMARPRSEGSSTLASGRARSFKAVRGRHPAPGRRPRGRRPSISR